MKFFLKIFFTGLMIVFVLSCKKDKNVLGVDVQPTEDGISADFSETAEVFAYSTTYDSIFIDNTRYKYLGINKDPYFGTTEVGLYTKVSVPDGKTFVSFGEDANLVSSEIILTAYNLGESHAGSLVANVNYSVYPIEKALDPERLYYSTVNNFYAPNVVVGSYSGTYTNLNGKLVLRIPMRKDFANAILTNPQYLYNNDAFQNTYKGFYIKCSLAAGDDGVIARLDLDDESSGFYVYYTNGSPSATKEEKSFRFVFGGTDYIRFNTVKNNFQNASATFVQQVVNKDTTKGADNLFVKGLGVSKLKVFIPSLKSYSDSFSVGVNRAEVIFNLDPSFVRSSTPPILCLLPMDSTGRETFALDQVNLTDAGRYNGKYDEAGNRYVFNIARHVQAVLNGKKKNYGFYLVVANAASLITYKYVYAGATKELFLVKRDNYIEGAVLAGSKHSTLKPVLNLSYIKFRHD